MTDTATSQRVTIVNAKSSTDIASILGVFGAFSTLIIGITLGGSLNSFFDLPSVFIVVGGTTAVTLACSNFKDFGGLLGAFGKLVRRSQTPKYETARQLLEITQLARVNGILSLQSYYNVLKKQKLLYKGVSMVVDGAQEREISAILELESDSSQTLRDKVTNLLVKAGDISPAMGLLGTLIGLIHMLVRLDDPASIGPAMAVALITTFYGVIMANLVFLPISSKMESYSDHQLVIDRMYILCVLSLQRQENPRRLEMQLNSMLPIKQQLRMFD